MDKDIKLKPLSCFYCANAFIRPGQHRTALVPYKPPTAICYCLTVSPEIFDLYEKKHGRLAMHAAGWMPYHCGHFIARMIRVKCAHTRCTKPIDTPEWLAAKYMYIGNSSALCCSNLCVEIHHKELLKRQVRQG